MCSCNRQQTWLKEINVGWRKAVYLLLHIIGISETLVCISIIQLSKNVTKYR